MSAKFRIGMIGCGDISRYVALLARLNPKIKIVGCSALHEESVIQFAKKYKIPACFTDYSELLNNVEMDAVYLAVPHNLHYPMIMDALDRGLHVFCEKPVSHNIDEALEICRVAREKGLKVGINYQYRYDPKCYTMVNAARGGQLGNLYYGRCNLPWHRDSDYFEISPWHCTMEEAGGGTLLTQASHILDLLLWSFNGKMKSAQGMTGQRVFTDVEVEDLAMGIIEMEDGRLVEVSSSMIAVPSRPVQIEVYGSKGTAIYTGFESERKLKVYGTKIKKSKLPVRGIHALSRSMDAFRLWIQKDIPYLIPVEQSLPVLAAISAIYKSAESGQKVEVDSRYLEYMNYG